MTVMAAIVGAILGIWLYCGMYGAVADMRNVTFAAAGGGIAVLLAFWLWDNGLALLGSIANFTMVALLLLAVIAVCAAWILAARRGNDYRIRTRLRWDRSHPRVSGHGPSDH